MRAPGGRPGHIIGYEHTFTHAVADFLNALAHGTPISPNFEDGVKGMQVLEAGLLSAATGQRVERRATSSRTDPVATEQSGAEMITRRPS